MPAYPVFASNKTLSQPAQNEKILVCGTNWIGDSIIGMPALQAFRRAYPSAVITLLVKPKLASLWKMHPVPNRIFTLDEGLVGTWNTAKGLQREQFNRAYILPNSFRSALIPFLARIPLRIGMPGHFRRRMLTHSVIPSKRAFDPHQAYEYLELMVPQKTREPLEPPRIFPSQDTIKSILNRIADLPEPHVGLLPGAARGPSKRWPAKHFSALGQMLATQKNAGIIVMGSKDEIELSNGISEKIGKNVLNLAGKLSLEEWAACIKTCNLVVSNDSGGMHVAAAVGTPLIALFGITDPEKTGPLGGRCRIIQQSTFRSRDIKRVDSRAEKILASILPEQVYEAALELLGMPKN